MNSMTGYGRATAVIGAHHLTVQVSSVNRKSLDVSVALPDGWDAVEPSVIDAVRRVVLRGKVHVGIEISGDESPVQWDEDAINSILGELAQLAAARGIEFKPTAQLLWEIAKSSENRMPAIPDDERSHQLLPAVNEALRGLAAMRAKEGEALLTRMARLHTHVEAIASRAPATVGSYREQLMQRLRAAGLALDVSDERVLKEIALFADRIDIAEELTRLRSHLAQLRELLRAEGEVGRKAEFILQEIGREIHTIGSKANDLAVSQRVIEFKNELERVREQMANVE
jgi:uncharacterized protein (TIGR00255 family)